MAGGRGALTRGFGGNGRGASAGGGAASGGLSDGGTGGAIEAGVASPRSIRSSLLVSRSIALTASHDDNAATSMVRSSASGGPAAKIAISGGLACRLRRPARLA